MIGWMLLGLAVMISRVGAGGAGCAGQTLSEEVIAEIKGDKDLQAGNYAKVKQIIETKLVPHFDFTRMTALAMGRNWRTATPEQQKQLTDQFRTLLVRTYSGALTNYREHTMDYKPLRMNAGDTEVTVRTEVRRQARRRCRSTTAWKRPRMDGRPMTSSSPA
jgi:phospholipid transport system substrate-binding protein